ncbi:hypothetical protein DFH07DRAFT_745444, partial [Mycena maculata]
NRSSKTVPNEIMKQYYDQRAVGGAGLIVTEGTLITRQGYVHCSPSCVTILMFLQNRMARCPRHLE